MANSSENNAQSANYDAHLQPSEVAARKEREGENFKDFPESENYIDTTGGYTMDREGKINNFAVEPEMYINEPGDLQEQKEEAQEARKEELKEINEPGGKGPGII